LQGIAYWNYNVKEQGLYNDTHDTAYDPETMFIQVSAGLPALRQLMATPGHSGEGFKPKTKPLQGCVLILSPPARSYEPIGAAREAVIQEVQPYQRLAILAKEGVNAAVVGSLDGWQVDGLQAIVVLSPAVGYLSTGDLAALHNLLGRGGKVITSPEVGAALADATHAAPELLYDGFVERRGNLYMAQKGIAVLFEDKRHEVLSKFWQEALGLDEPQPGYRIETDRLVFDYHIGPEPATVRRTLPFETIGYRYDDQARPAERLHGSTLAVTLGRREYIFLRRVSWFRPFVRQFVPRLVPPLSCASPSRSAN